MTKDSGSGFATGLIMGALIGVVVGFLYAPQSGTETRRLVKEKTEVIKEKAARAARHVKDVLQSRLEGEEE